MIEDYLHGREAHRNVENPGESSSEGGGHRFIFYGNPGAAGKKKTAKSKTEIEAPVKLDLTGESLADEIVEVHNEPAVHDKVEELGDKINDIDENDDQKDNQ